MSHLDNQLRWSGIRCLLERAGPFQRREFEPDNGLVDTIQENLRLLIIGAGGLGCELLKDLSLMGFRHLEIIDMDTIDTSNLNRQFLFRPKDIGRSKSEVAAEFIMKRIPGTHVVPHFKRIQEFDEDFYRSFHIVISGLDSIVARRWINGMLAGLVQYDKNGDIDPYSVIPLIDGGTEGFKGNARVILFGQTPCIECTLDLYPPQVNFPLCTIAHTPRLPEHCIEYVRVLLWPQEKPFGNVPIDGDSPEHLQWIYENSVVRAQEFHITGVTRRLTQGVVKRIIPAVASTNAVIAAACTTEVFKIASFCYDYLNNYLNFNDSDGVYTYSFEAERKDDCLACNNIARRVTLSDNSTLQDFINYLKENAELQMKSPGITTMIEGRNKTLYMHTKSLAEQLKPNLKMTLKELGITDGQIMNVADETTPRVVMFQLNLTSDMDS